MNYDALISAIQVMLIILAPFVTMAIWLVAKERAKRIDNKGMQEIRMLKDEIERLSKTVDRLQERLEDIIDLMIKKNR